MSIRSPDLQPSGKFWGNACPIPLVLRHYSLQGLMARAWLPSFPSEKAASPALGRVAPGTRPPQRALGRQEAFTELTPESH